MTDRTASTGPASSGPASTGPVVAVVRIPTPRLAPRRLVRRKMRATIDQYAAIAGLAFKAYAFEQESGDYGGVYSWTDREAAEAWFDQVWFERVRRERGSEPSVRFFDAPRSIDNTPGGTKAAEGGHVVTLVEIPLPEGVTEELLLAGFEAAEPSYREAPGLLRKHFIHTAPGRTAPRAAGTVPGSPRGATFGGVYLWADEASARRWFDAAWHERVRSRYGADGRIEWFDAPILLPTRVAAERPLAQSA